MMSLEHRVRERRVLTVLEYASMSESHHTHYLVNAAMALKFRVIISLLRMRKLTTV